ncbi:CPBP family intramembrane glutamic endopeptidase [Lysinibacillus sp. KU-BSD001]|uniref:CPBP family intramembrane glutamic endopeptidase n=1 Tax=Lysinibacillus sp. KU-BSD001 TaxID=3141328 RepID=UPI0036E9C1F5
MKQSDKEIFLQLVVGNIIFAVIGIVLLNITSSKNIFVSITQLFSLQEGVFSLIVGLVGFFAVSLYTFIVIKAGKGYFPNTKGSNVIVQLANNQKLSLIGIVLLPSILEELLFRGVIQPLMVEMFNPFWGVIMTAFLFMLVHISDQYKGQPFLLFHTFWLGIITGVAFTMTNSLWAPIIIHFLNNYWSVKKIRDGTIGIKS